MATSDFPNVNPMPAPASGPTGPSTGSWLGSQSVFDQRDERKLGRALLSSVLAHGSILLIIALGIGVQQVVEQQKEPPVKFEMLYIKAPGPGGGGGGSPQPAPPKKLEVPTPKAPEPVPAPPPPVVPPPTLNAPVTTLSQTLQASGQSSVSFSAVGGGGSGGGIGAGRGNGLGEGTGGGTGGGVYQPGNGVSWPTLIRQVEPQYTSEAMRAKIQGTVYLTGVVQPNGLVGDIKVSKSLDRTYGLDQAAIDAAKRWLFSPCKKDGASVPCQIQLELDFRLH
jgi:protein TonB